MRVILVLLLVTTPAWADDIEPEGTFHKGQFGMSARFGLGVRGIATYDSMDYCGKLDPEAEFGNAPVCAGRTPISLDLEAAYGIAKSIELTLELRIGIESDIGSSPSTDGPRPLALLPGARFFFSEAKHTKLFFEPQLVLDFADYSQSAGNDFGVRGIEGFWIDLHRSYGFYFWIAETFEVRRWLSFAFEGGIGFQGRYP